jgi:IclR family acetate operon transcriptional repressor
MTTMATKRAAPPSTAQSPSYMGRMLDLLELAVTDPASPFTLSELADRAGIPQSTASRLLGQLTSWGFLTEGAGARHAPGPRLVGMSAAVAEWMHGDRRLTEATRALSAATGESATAGRVVGERIVIVARTESRRALRAVNRTGEVVPASRSAIGKAILSGLPRPRQLDLLRAEGVAEPARTLDGLADELAEARERGYAVDEENLSVGLRCRAMAIPGWDGPPVAALSVGGPTARFTAEVADGSVRALRTEISRLNG